MADNIILLRITPMLPYEWSNLRRLFDCKSTFETRSGPFDYWRIRLEFDGNLIHWTVSDGWWHPKTTTFDTDYETTMTVLFDVGYDQWRKDRGIMDEADKAVKRLNDSGIPATRSSDPDYLVFEVGESVFRALLPADPTHAASRLIEAVRNRGKILDGYRKTVAGLGRVEALEADDVYWDDLFSNGDPVEPPTGIDGFRTDTIYDFKDLDVLSATFAITHLYSGFNPNHHVIVRAHESYTDPPAPVIDSINNRQLRQSGGTRYLKVSRTVLDKEK